MAAVATLKAMLGLDTKAYKASMKDARKSADSLKRKLAGVGAALGASFGLAAIVAGTKALINFASEIRHTADNLEISTDALQALTSTALRFGMSSEQTVKLLGRLRQSQGEVKAGTVTYTDALDALGIRQAEFNRLDTPAALFAIARAYSTATDRTAAFSAVTDLLGRSGKEATAWMEKLAGTDLSGIRSEAEKANEILGPEAATAMEAFGTSIERFGLKTKVTIGNMIIGWRDWRRELEEAMGGTALTNEAPPQEGTPPIVTENFSAANAKLAAQTEKMAHSRLTGKEREAADFKAAEERIQDAIREAHSKGNEKGRQLLSEQLRDLRAHHRKRGRERQLAREKEAAEDAAETQEKISALKERGNKAVAQERERLKEREAGIAGVGARTDSLASVGGSVGGSRAGIGMADRQLKIQIEAAAMRRRIIQIQEEQARDIKTIADATDRR